MAELQYVKSLLNTGIATEGSLLIEKTIYETLITEVGKALIPRELAAVYVGPDGIKGSSVDFDLETPLTGIVRLTGEGSAYVLDNSEYTNVNIKPAKYGVLLRITRELIEDAKWPILEKQLVVFGRRMAENENKLVIAALDGAANSVTGGAAITIPNITRAMQYLEDSDFVPSDIIVGNDVVNDIRNIDTFVEYLKVGNTEILNSGFIGTLYGLQTTRVSSNAGMTGTSSYVIDRRQAYAIAEKRTYTVESFDVQTHDMSACALSQRIAVKLLRSSAVAKITTT